MKSRFSNVFTPRYYSLFPCLEKDAVNLVNTASQLKLLTDSDQSESKLKIAARINELNIRGNNITRETYDLLDNLFIVPFDREDINLLLNKIDDLMDSLNETGKMILSFNLTTRIPVYIELTEILYSMAAEIGVCVKNLKDVPGNKKKIIISCARIETLAKSADEIIFAGMASIFGNGADFTYMTRSKNFLERIRQCIDESRFVERIIKKILIKAV
jgi:hypothetical protein